MYVRDFLLHDPSPSSLPLTIHFSWVLVLFRYQRELDPVDHPPSRLTHHQNDYGDWNHRQSWI